MPNVNEYMLKQADAEAIYQKKLNAGTGISIDPLTDTISATGSGGSTVTYTPNVTTGMILGILGINGASNPIKSPSLIAGQNVSITQDQTTGALTFSSVNTTYNDMIGADGTDPGTHGLAPAPTATDNTKFLKGDGSWGDPVTANPVAAATATLTKLSINNIVYDLAGGTATYLGTTDPSNSIGNNGDLYFKYVSVPAVIEDEVSLPTFVDDQSTHVTVPHFEDYTDVSFGYIDANRNPGTKDFTIEDLPQNNDPQWSQGGDIYIMNGYYYAVVSRDSTGFWIKECGSPLQSITVSYSGYSYNIISTYVKIEGRWIAFSTGGGGAINDVEVDGVSVVNASGVAEIDLTGKQNTLNAGTNISIDTTTNTISATDTTYNDFAGSTHGLVPAVQTQAGKYLKDDGTWGTPSGGGGGGTGSFVGLTKTEYDALPTADKEDTTKLYFVQEGGETTEVTDLVGTSSDWGMFREGSMTITWNNNDEIVFDWVGGSSIGGDIVKTAVIPANASKIRFKITTGSAYDTNTQRFKLGIGVRTTYTTNVVLDGYNVSDWLAFKNFNTTNSIWEDELDLSNVTVDTYLYIIGHGWDATVNKLEMVAPPDSSEVTYYTYWNNIKRAQWNQIKELTQAEYNALSTDEKQNGNLYLTHDGGYDFISYDSGKIVVRVNNSTGQTLWFFNGFTKESADMDVPAELVPYLPTQTSPISVMMAKSWTDDTSTTTNGWVGFLYPGTSNVKIRTWNANGSQLRSGESWAVLDIDGSVAEFGQTAPYSAPTEGLSLLPNRIYFNGTKYAENSASGSGSNYSRTVLYNTDFASAGQFTLSDDITNYDEIEIVVGFTNGTTKTTFKFNSAWFKNEFPYVAGATSSTNHFLACVYATYYIRLIMGDADNKLYMTETNDLMIEEVAGITY